jgi:hypothetical protein
MITIKKINDTVIKKVKLKDDTSNKPIKGFSLFPEVYSNVYCCSKKKSGKTTVLFNIIKKCCDKNTKVIIFCSTVHKDSTYKSILDYLDKKDIDYATYTSLKEDKIDRLQQLVEDLQQEADPQTEKENNKNNLLLFDEPESEEEEKEKDSKYRAPEYMIILDDLSTELKSKSLVSLLKKNRHFKSKIIISSQYWNDLLPESRKQLDYILLFKSMPENKLKEIYRDADLSIDYETFLKLYRYSTKEPYNFFYIDCVNDEYRKNFNMKFNLPKE